MDDLKELVSLSAAGDVAAFEELVGRFQHMACGYAYSVLGDFHLAEDAAQEAFVDAYRLLEELREPAAFPGWLRRIVYKHCDRQTRRRPAQVPLEAAGEPVASEASPAAILERRETEARVRAAIASLSEVQREVTTLFYIQRHSQREIAAFLEVPLTTVKKRLVDARKKLKERMLDMVSETLQEHGPDGRFPQKVIAELLGRPHPLAIEGHPVRRIWDQICAALPEWEVLGESDDVVDRAVYPSIQEAMDRISDHSYQVDADKVLRSHMTHTVLQVIAGRTAPVRLLSAGRCFRGATGGHEDKSRIRVFYQGEATCIEPGVDAAALRQAMEGLMRAIVGEVELRWIDRESAYMDGMIEVDGPFRGEWLNMSCGGMLKPEMLSQAGYDPAVVSGYSFGFGLERLLQVRDGIEDIRELWKPPYVGDN